MDIKHTYNFTATFEDGTQIVHDMEQSDASTRFEGKTLFTDVLFKCGQLGKDNDIFKDKPELLEEMESNKNALHSFVIHSDSQSLGVDLRDGHFELNGIPFFQHRSDIDNYKDFRIMYFRTVVREINATNGESVDAYIKGYTVGWQVTHNGENVQRIVSI